MLKVLFSLCFATTISKEITVSFQTQAYTIFTRFHSDTALKTGNVNELSVG